MALVSSSSLTITDVNDSVALVFNRETIVIPTKEDGSGGVFDATTATTVSVLFGITDKSADFSFSAIPTGISGSWSSATRTFTITGMSSDSGSISFSATSGPTTLTKIIPVTRQKQGVSSVSYSLVRSSNTITNKDGTFSPSTITYSSYQQTGDQTPAPYAGRFNIYQNDVLLYTSASDESSTVVTPLYNTKEIKGELYLAGGTTSLLDSQTTPILIDLGTAVSNTYTGSGRVYSQSTDPYPIHPTFARTSSAFNNSGLSLSANTPRIEQGKYGQSITVEEGTTNLLTENQATFTTDLSGITAYNNHSITRIITDGVCGSKSIEITSTGPGNGSDGFVNYDNIILTPGLTYVWSFYAKSISGNNQLQASFWGESGEYVTLTSDWVRYYHTAQAPEYPYLYWWLNETGVCRISAVQVEQKDRITSFSIGTRAPETLQIPATNSLINFDEGTMELWFRPSKAYRNINPISIIQTKIPLGCDTTGLYTGALTFSRAAGTGGVPGVYVNDYEGRPTYVVADSPAFEGSRAVTNLLTYSEDFSNPAWTKVYTVTYVADSLLGRNVAAVDMSSGGSAGLLSSVAANTSTSKTMMALLRGQVGGELAIIALCDSVGTKLVEKTITLSSEWQWYSLTTSSNAIRTVRIARAQTTGTYYVGAAQLEDVFGQVNKNPGGYVKTTSASVTKSFDTMNENYVPQNKCTCYGVPRADSLGAERVQNSILTGNPATGWSTATGILPADGVITITGALNNVAVYSGSLVTPLLGTYVTVTYRIVSISSGGVRVIVYNGNATTTRSTTGTYTETVSVGGNTGSPFYLQCVGTTTAVIDLVSVKEAIDYVDTKAYHNGTASQNNITGMALSGSDTLGVTEILTNPSFDASVSPWIGTGANLSIANTGGTQAGANYLVITGTNISNAKASHPTLTITPGVRYRATVYVKSGTAGNIAGFLRLWNGTNASEYGRTTFTSSSAWTQITYEFVAAGTLAVFDLFVVPATTGTTLFDTASLRTITYPAVLSIVTDSDELASAGLNSLTNGDKVYRLNNTASANAAFLDFGGNTGLNLLSTSILYRIASAGTGSNNQLRFQDTTSAIDLYSAIYTRATNNSVITTLASNLLQLRGAPGADIYFIAPQLEEDYKANPITLTYGVAYDPRIVVETIGTPLHPWTYEQGTKRYLTFDARENLTDYVLDKRIHATATDGLEHWYTCTTAGTSHSSAPTFPTSGTVAEGSGTVVWTYGGLYRIKGLLMEPASVNKCTCYGVPRVDGTLKSLGTLSFGGTNWVNTTGLSFQHTAGSTAVLGGTGATAIILGEFVRATFTISGRTAGTVQFRQGGITGGTPYSDNAQHIDILQFASTGNVSIAFQPSSDFDGTVTINEIVVLADYVGTKAYHNGTAFQNPIPGMTLSGDVAAVLSIVTDATELANAKLDGLTNGNKLYKVVTGAGGTADVDFAGAMTAVTTSMSVIYRASAGSVVLSDNDNANATASLTSATYVRASKDGFTATNTKLTRLRFAASSTVYFMLVQNEAGASTTSIMPTLGATASRATTVVSLPVSGNIPATAGYQESINHIVTQTTGTQMIWCIGDTTNGLRLFHTGAVYCLQKIVSSVSTYVTIAKTLVLGEVNKILVRVNADWTCNLFLNGVKDAGGLSNELCTDPSFDNAGAWDVPTPTGWSFSGSQLIGASVTGRVRQLAIATTGKLYQQSLVLPSFTGTMYFSFGTTTVQITGTGAKTEVAFNTGTYLGLSVTLSSNLTADSISFKEVYNNTDTTPIVLGTTLYLGADSVGASHINGNIRDLTIYNKLLSNKSCMYITNNLDLTTNTWDDSDGFNRLAGHSTGIDTNEIQLIRSSDSPNISLAISDNSGNWSGITNKWDDVTSTTRLANDKWYHIAGTWSKSLAKFCLYVNGELEADGDYTHYPSVFGKIDIGCHSDFGRQANGQIDNFKISNTAKSATEIYSSYISSAPAQRQTDTLLLLPFNTNDTWINASSSPIITSIYDGCKWIEASTYGMSASEMVLLGSLQSQADNKISVYVQATTPPITWGDDLVSNHIGDQWFNTSDKKWHSFDGADWDTISDTSVYDATTLASGKTTYLYETGTTSPNTASGVVNDFCLYKNTSTGIVTTYKKTGAATWTAQSGSFADGATKNTVSSGTLSARPAGSDGDIYYASDINKTYTKANGKWTTSELDNTNYINCFTEFSVNDWVSNNGVGETTLISDATATAGKVLSIGNNADNDQAWLTGVINIPFDPTKLYRIRSRAKIVSGTGALYLGIAGVAADGVAFVNTVGTNSHSSQHYLAASGATIASVGSGWVEHIGYFKGTAATGSSPACPSIMSPGKLHVNCKYFKPLILANYNTLAGQVYIDYFIIEAISDVTELGYTGALDATNGAPDGTLVGDQLAEDVALNSTVTSSWKHTSDITKIDGGDVYTGSITATKLSINSRGVSFNGLNFSTNGNIISWTLGTANYISDDAQTIQSISVSASSATWTTGTLYIYWEKNATGLKSNSNVLIASTPDTIVIAKYTPGGGLLATFGGTIIEGGKIVTNSIAGNKITVGTLTGDRIVSASISGDLISANTIDAVNIKYGTITGERIDANTISFGNLVALDRNSYNEDFGTEFETKWYNGSIVTPTVKPTITKEPNNGIVGTFTTMVVIN